MKKISFLLAILMLLSCLALFSCGGDNGGETTAPETTNPETTAPETEPRPKNLICAEAEKTNEGVAVSWQVGGDVCFAGLEGSLQAPAGWSIAQYTAHSGLQAALRDGVLSFVYISSSGENTTVPTPLLTVVFAPSAEAADATVQLQMGEFFDRNLNDVVYSFEESTVPLHK